MSSSPLRVMVIGGGIGGLCLAQALKAADMDVAVYERNPSPTEWLQGYRININPTGSWALHECLPTVLWEVFIATAGKPSAGFGFMTEQLKELLVIDEGLMSGGATAPEKTQHPVSRIALRHVLLSGLDDVIQFDKTFERYEQSAMGKVTAFFTDGSSATGDVLVGADGANSHVRKQYLPQAQRVETGALSIGGKLLLNEQTRAWLPRPLATRMNIITPLSRYFMFSAVFDHTYSPTETLNRVDAHAKSAGLRTELLFNDVEDYALWAFAAHRDAYPANAQDLDGAALQQFMIETIADWHPDLRRMVVESDPASVNLLSLKTSVPVEPWETTNVTLLGDAIHNMTPLAGMGANTALRDASLLARKLIAVERGEASLLPAIHAYEAQMIKYGFEAVRGSLQNTQRAISNNRVARLTGRAFFRLCNTFPALKRRAFGNNQTDPELQPA